MQVSVGFMQQPDGKVGKLKANDDRKQEIGIKPPYEACIGNRQIETDPFYCK